MHFNTIALDGLKKNCYIENLFDTQEGRRYADRGNDKDDLLDHDSTIATPRTLFIGLNSVHSTGANDSIEIQQ